MTEISLPYGDGTIEAMLPDGLPVRTVEPPRQKVTVPIRELIRESLANPAGTPRLEKMLSPGERVTVIVNDQTRPGPNQIITEELTHILSDAGIPDENITFVIATGSHRAPTQDELHVILGADACRRFRIHLHECQSPDHVYLGKTADGLPVWVDSLVAKSDFIITTGLIAPHHAAGYSGGRKSIVPGVAGIETLRIHHSLPIRQYEPAMGFWEGNPFHESALEAAKMTNVRFIVNTVQDGYKQDFACVAGDLEAAHRAGVEMSRRACSVDVGQPAELVIASPGGAPRDCNLYQAQKALSAAELFGRSGECTFIMCARAEDGIGGDTFRQWMREAKTPAEVVERFRREGYNPGSNKAFMYARALLKGRVIIASGHLNGEELSSMMLEWAPDLQKAVDMALEERMPRQVVLLPKAVSMVPVYSE